MGNKVTVVKGDVTEVFEDVIGHQVGNGAIQVLESSGNQRIINSFDDVTVELDEEAAAQFAFDLVTMQANAEARADNTSAEQAYVEPEVAGEDDDVDADGHDDGSVADSEEDADAEPVKH